MRILFATLTLFPYRVDWLSELGKEADVDIFYLSDTDKDRNHQWMSKRPDNCRYTLMKSIRIPFLGNISFDFIKYVSKNGQNYDVIILDGYGFTTQILNCIYLNSKKYRYFVNIDGIVKNEHENKWIGAVKKSIIGRFPYCLCGSFSSNRILNEYGVSDSRIINHPFSSLHTNDIFDCVADTEEKRRLRKKHNIPEKKMILSVGRFSYMGGYGKGFDVLVKAAKRMGNDIGWYIVGGPATEEFKKMTENTKNVHFVDFLDRNMLKEFYRASDLFCLMTVSDVWGLVVNEAMACALPVITTYKCVAGLDLVRNGINGFLVEPGDDAALEKYVCEILNNQTEAVRMSEASLDMINNYTVEKMAEIHLKAFREIISADI